MATHEPTEIRGYLYIVLANLSFAAGFSFVAATGGAMSVWQLVLVRGVVFGLALLPWAARHPQVALGTNRRLLLVRGGLGTAMILCLVTALTLLPLSIATLLGKTTPLWELAMLWALLALRPRRTELLLAPVAIVGLVLILHPEGRFDFGTLSHLGLLAALGAGLLNSLEFIALGRVRRTEQAQTINLWYAAVAIVATLPFALTQPWPQDPRIWLFAVLFCLGSLAGQSLLAAAMHSVSPTLASVGTLLVPIFATLIGWIAFGQLLSGIELVGMAIVLAPAALVARMEAGQAAALARARFRWQRS